MTTLNWTTQDLIMARDALRWFSDQQEAARANIPAEAAEIHKAGAGLDAWRRRLADDLDAVLKESTE